MGDDWRKIAISLIDRVLNVNRLQASSGFLRRSLRVAVEAGYCNFDAGRGYGELVRLLSVNMSHRDTKWGYWQQTVFRFGCTWWAHSVWSDERNWATNQKAGSSNLSGRTIFSIT